jgi:WD40 repeat protein
MPRAVCTILALLFAAVSTGVAAPKATRAPQGRRPQPPARQPAKPTKVAEPTLPSPTPPLPGSLTQPGSQPALFLDIGHTGPLYNIFFSPDGKLLATSDWGGSVRVWDLQTGRLRAAPDGDHRDDRCGGFSPDGRLLATSANKKEVRLWDTRTLQLAASLQGHTAPIDGFSLSDTLAATGSQDSTARVWDVRTGRTLAILRGHKGGVQVALAPDGKSVATGSEDGALRLWDLPGGQLRATLQGHTAPFVTITYSPDGKILATASQDRTARLWDVGAGQLKAVLQGHREVVNTVRFSPDGRMLATGSNDRTVRLWDARTGEVKKVLAEPQIWANTWLGLAFSPDGRLLATGGFPVRLWDTASGLLAGTLRASSGGIAVAFSPDGKTLGTADGDGSVRLWDVAICQLAGQMQASLSGVTKRPVLSLDGRTLAVGSYDAVRLWDLATGQLKRGFRHESFKSGVAPALSPDGKALATVSRELVALWDAQSGQLRWALPHPGQEIWAPAFSPDGKILAANCQQHTDGSSSIRLWNATDGQLKSTLSADRSPVDALLFSPDGQVLAAAGVYLWDTANGQVKAALPGSRLLAYSPDGKWLAAAAESTVVLLDVASGEYKATLQIQPAVCQELAFSHDGALLGIVGTDYRLRRWDVRTGHLLPGDIGNHLTEFPIQVTRPLSAVGATVRLHDPRDGRVTAAVSPVPSALGEASSEWCVTTREGYFDCSANATAYLKCNVGGTVYSAAQYLARSRRPDLVARALRGEGLSAALVANAAIPPAVQFVGLKSGDRVPGNPMNVTLEAGDDREVQRVALLVNNRPLPPEEARPIEVGARPLEPGARPLEPGARPIDIGARDGDSNHRVYRRFTFRISVPPGENEVRLKAIAYDAGGLASEPAEVLLAGAGGKSVTGNLYALCVGVGRYKQGSGSGNDGRISNLRYPAADAKALGERLKRESGSLYARVEVRTLTDEQATLPNLRSGLKWLQESVRPGQIDTAVLFLSGHGISLDGRYHFAAHETDLKNLGETTLSGRELREALGGKLRARAVFLFVDTCHSGGLDGRNDDLVLEVGEGVYLLASSSAREYAYESEKWGHGAFTLALLRALDKKELASGGVIHFNALTYAVPEEVARLMKEAGRSETEQEPCVPLASRRLRVPLAQAPR